MIYPVDSAVHRLNNWGQVSIGRFQPTSRDTNNNSHSTSGGRTKEANKRSLVFVHQPPGGDDVT